MRAQQTHDSAKNRIATSARPPNRLSGAPWIRIRPCQKRTYTRSPHLRHPRFAVVSPAQKSHFCAQKSHFEPGDRSNTAKRASTRAAFTVNATARAGLPGSTDVVVCGPHADGTRTARGLNHRVRTWYTTTSVPLTGDPASQSLGRRVSGARAFLREKEDERPTFPSRYDHRAK